MTDRDAREILRGMLADWNAATPEERKAALAKASTAALRAEARLAEEALEYERAADLYAAALEAYPPTPGELAVRDRDGLRASALRCRLGLSA